MIQSKLGCVTQNAKCILYFVSCVHSSATGWFHYLCKHTIITLGGRALKGACATQVFHTTCSCSPHNAPHSPSIFMCHLKYQVKAAYIIINFVIARDLIALLTGSPRCDAPCHTLCVLRPSRASSGNKPRRLQLWKRVAIPQVFPNNKKLQPIATMHCQWTQWIWTRDSCSYLLISHKTRTVTDASHNGKHLRCLYTQEGILEWSQRLELDYIEVMGSRKDPELHAKMFCDGMVQMQSELMVCLVNERGKSLLHVY